MEDSWFKTPTKRKKMRCVIMDSWGGKFTASLKEYWESQGHQVLFNPPWGAMEEADVTFFYQADNGLVTASTEKIKTKGKVYAQCVDIEVWAGQPMAVDWNYVDGLIFMADHIRDYVLPQITPPEKVALIKPGIDLKKFTLKKSTASLEREKSPIRRIAYVVGDRRIWDVKRFDVALMLLKDLIDSTGLIWQLHVLGSYSSHVQYNDYCEHLIKNLQLEGFVIWHERVESVNDWLEDKDFFLLPSTKEAFSYATAEAMAKGIKPIIGNWRGIDKTWAPFYCKTYGQMYESFLQDYNNSEGYREFVEKNYDQERYFKELSEFMELKGGEIK